MYEEKEVNTATCEPKSVLSFALFRGDGLYNGCKTIEEMIDVLNAQITSLQKLKKQGFELHNTVKNDNAYVQKLFT